MKNRIPLQFNFGSRRRQWPIRRWRWNFGLMFTLATAAVFRVLLELGVRIWSSAEGALFERVHLMIRRSMKKQET